MKTKLKIIVLLIILSAGKISAQAFLDQYFDGADSSYINSLFVHIDTAAGNIWQVGKPQKIIFDSAATFRNAIVTDTVNNYPVNNTSSFYFNIKPYAFGSNQILGVQWKQKLDMDKKRDGGLVEFTTDYGATWQNAFNNPYVYNYFGFDPQNKDTLLTGEYAFSGTDSTWQDVWLCYSLSWMSMVSDSITVRFTFKSDGINNPREGWLIDNMHAHITMVHPVKENANGEYFNVYPNPAKNVINIELDRRNEFHIIESLQLVDAQGKLMQEWKNVPTRFWIDVSKYANGMYYLRVKSNFKSKTFPISIQK